MAKTKLVAREYYRSQRDRFQIPARFAAAKTKVERKNKTNKVKKLLPQGKNADVKKNRRIVRKMVARHRSIFPPLKRLHL